MAMKKILVKSTAVEVKAEPSPYEEASSQDRVRIWANFSKLWGQKHSGIGWKPATLRAPILAPMVAASLGLIILLEILSHISVRNQSEGGIAFAVDVDSFSARTEFGYLYLPTILAVCYSMLWTWIDLDVKRLEPWFQLSQKGGATAVDSLLLQYPFDFLPFIPVSAMRRKHWTVFFAGSVMLMVFWVVTPLNSAIFNTGTVSRNTTAGMVTYMNLTQFDQQPLALNANFMNTAYGISWLDQRLPPYSTNDIVMLPFQPRENAAQISSTETWSTTATVFFTNLTCFPAEVQHGALGYTFSNGKGCTVPDVALSTTLQADYLVNYIGYFDNPNVDWSLQSPNCSAAFSNNFLALWASAASQVDRGVYSNLTALFCEPTYASQEMYVTVNASTGAVSQVAPAGGNASLPLLTDIFNVTNFEYLLGTGVSSTSTRSNFQDSAVLQQDARINDYKISWPTSNMVGFAAALNTGSVADLSVAKNLQLTFQRAHQLLFTTAFNTLTTETIAQESQQTIAGVRQEVLGAIILVRPISVAVEAALGTIIFFTLCLWFVVHRRPSHLSQDPAAISDIMSLLSTPTELSKVINDDGTLTSDKLAAVLSTKRYYMGEGQNGKICILDVVSDDGNQQATLVQKRTSSNQEEKRFVPVRPTELSLVFGCIFIGTIVLALASILFLGIRSSQHNGISLPSSNTVVRSIIENYAPTMFATLIEPVWTILNRLLCLLEPFEELRKGKANASKSLEVKYTSLPPQLTFWRALRAGDFILAAVCIIAVSSNVLAVALSGLLSESPTFVALPVSASQTLLPHFNGTPIFDPTILSGPGAYFDPFYVAMSNITESTPLPPWVDEKFFYLPFTLASVESIAGGSADFQSFRGSTVGFGATVTCIEISSQDGSDSLQFEVNHDGSSIQFSTSHLLENGTDITCVYPRTAGKATNETTDNIAAFPSDGPLALEAVQTMQPLANISDGGFCGASLIVGWARVDAETQPNSTRSTSSTFLSCTQKLATAQFEVEVDISGRIVTSRRTTAFDTDTDSYFTPNASLPSAFQNSSYFGPINTENHLLQQGSSLIASFGPNDFQWHNDSITADWMNALLAMIKNSTDLVNPQAPLPNATVVGPMVEALYEQLFAILLGLNTHVFIEAQADTSATVEAIFVESRIFVSKTMFILTIIILTLHLFAAFVYYIFRPTRFLPRMPTSIASIIAFVCTSRAVADYNGGTRVDDDPDPRYGYGRFVGIDGKTHVGIERQRFVVPLQSRNPDVRRRKRDIFKRKDESQPRSWI